MTMTMTMNCENYKALLAAEIYGDNTPEDRRALASHLTSCADCRKLEAEWREAVRRVAPPAVPTDDAFWIRQRAAIMEKLPSRTRHAWIPWARLAGPIMAMGVLVSVWGWHAQNERAAFRIAQNMELLQNIDMLQQLDVVENLDVVEMQ
jgi:predicted anti-sigma-YlaC factor YlaD